MDKLTLQSFRLFRVIVNQPIQILHHIVLQKGVKFIEAADNLFQFRIFGGVKHLSRPGFEPAFIRTVGEADHFNKTVINMAVVCLNSALKRTAQFDPLGEFFLRIPQGFTEEDDSFVYRELFFRQISAPIRSYSIKNWGYGQENFLFFYLLTVLSLQHIILSRKHFKIFGLFYEE